MALYHWTFTLNSVQIVFGSIGLVALVAFCVVLFRKERS